MTTSVHLRSRDMAKLHRSIQFGIAEHSKHKPSMGDRIKTLRSDYFGLEAIPRFS